MMQPSSNHLSERVVAAVLSGESSRTVASRFGFAISSVVKWSQRHRATGSVQLGKMGGHRRRVLEPHRNFLIERLTENPHQTLHGLKNELSSRGITVPITPFGSSSGARGSASKKHCLSLSRPAPTYPEDASGGRLCGGLHDRTLRAIGGIDPVSTVGTLVQTIQPKEMRKRPQKCRLCFRQNMKNSSTIVIVVRH